MLGSETLCPKFWPLCGDKNPAERGPWPKLLHLKCLIPKVWQLLRQKWFAFIFFFLFYSSSSSTPDQYAAKYIEKTTNGRGIPTIVFIVRFFKYIYIVLCLMTADRTVIKIFQDDVEIFLREKSTSVEVTSCFIDS